MVVSFALCGDHKRRRACGNDVLTHADELIDRHVALGRIDGLVNDPEITESVSAAPGDRRSVVNRRGFRRQLSSARRNVPPTLPAVF